MKINNSDSLRLIIEDQKMEIQILRDTIYELQVDNEYMKLKLADLQTPDERRSTLNLLTFNK